MDWASRENLDVLTGGVTNRADWNWVSPWRTSWAVDWAAGFPSTESSCSDSGLALGEGTCLGGASSLVTVQMVTCAGFQVTSGEIGAGVAVAAIADGVQMPSPASLAGLTTMPPACGLTRGLGERG